MMRPDQQPFYSRKLGSFGLWLNSPVIGRMAIPRNAVGIAVSLSLNVPAWEASSCLVKQCHPIWRTN